MTEIQVSWQVLRWWKMLASSNALSDRLAERSHDYATHAVCFMARLTKSRVNIGGTLLHKWAKWSANLPYV